MARTMTKNGQAEKETEVNLEVDIDELRVMLGINALENQIASLQETFAQWLTYVNMVDMRIQELSGEKVVTQTHRFTFGPDGNLELRRSKPVLPENLVKRAPKAK